MTPYDRLKPKSDSGGFTKFKRRFIDRPVVVIVVVTVVDVVVKVSGGDRETIGSYLFPRLIHDVMTSLITS